MKYLPKYPMLGYLLGGKIEFTDDEKQELHELCNEYMLPKHAFKELYKELEIWADKCTTFEDLKHTFHSHLWCYYHTNEKYIQYL